MMEWRSNLRRTQSLKTIPSSCDKPSWTGAGHQDRKASVSQLVSRYQTTVEVSTSIQVTAKSNEAKMTVHSSTTIPPPHESRHLESKENKLESLIMRSDERERFRAKTSLSRWNSMSSLQNDGATIEARKARFESNHDAPRTVRRSFRAASCTSLANAADGEAEAVKNPAEEWKSKTPTAVVQGRQWKAHAKEDVTRKVVNKTRTQRRKTIGGIDFERIAASHADDKKRLLGDFRDSSYVQAKENLCVSVKAISALYLSKVAPREPTASILKQAQDLSPGSGKRAKITKMAEDSQQKMDDPLLPPSAKLQLEDSSEARSMQQSMPPHLSKATLYQKRQKCELRRLLKHTNPEKMLDVAVDEEFAEVLSSECGSTAGETEYEGEVLSRCLIFENCALSNKVHPHAPVMHMAAGTVERGNVSKTSAAFVEQGERLSSNSDPVQEHEEEMNRVDVQATRRMFERQSVDTFSPSPDYRPQGKVSTNEDEIGAVQKQKKEFETCDKENLHSENKSSKSIKSVDLTEEPQEQRPCVDATGQSDDCEFSENQHGSKEVCIGEAVFEEDFPNAQSVGGKIKTSSSLLQNNPFISTNVERENSYMRKNTSAEDYVTANVKSRTHLFESMPFDKIRRQNSDEAETMVENINQTLHSLYRSHTIYSDGSIIEVNERMIAKKAKFTLSESGPMIKYDEVAEGGAQNFILQLLPRSNLKPQITYLKEDDQGCMKTTVVNVPVHQHHFAANQDAEFKTANVVQLVEDILNQDNSLRKGVIIQGEADMCAEVIVYSLYNYADGDVKSYILPEENSMETDEPESKRDNQVSSQDQEEGSPSEWAPVDVKRLKNIFSGDQRQIQQKQCDVPTKSSTSASTGQKVLLGKGEPSAESDVRSSSNEKVKSDFRECSSPELQKACPCNVEPQGWCLNLDTQDIDMIHQAELVEVVDEDDEISNLQSAIDCLQQATLAAKALYHSSEDKEKLPSQGSSAELIASTITAENQRMEAELPPEKMKKEKVSTEQMCEASSATNIISENQHKTPTPRCEITDFEEIHDTEVAFLKEQATKPAQQEDEEVVFHGTVQAALDFLERSKVNVTRGGFRAAMIYRNSSKSHKERSQIVDDVQKPTKDEVHSVTETKSALSQRNDVATEAETDAILEPTNQSQTPNKPAASVEPERRRRVVGPKPAIPPKPEHLKVKHKNNQLPNKESLEALETKTMRSETKPLPTASVSYKDKDIRDMSKLNGGAESGPGLVDRKCDRNNMYDDKAIPISEENQVSHGVHGSAITLGNQKNAISTCTDNIVNQSEELNTTVEGKHLQDFPVNEDRNETDESHVDFNEACQKFGGKKAFSVQNAPVKPKRLNIAQNSTVLTHANGEPQQNPSSNNPKTEIRQESNVCMREKKGKTETEGERRQRLSVHMDEIMRGNITAAMEIFDKLQKQEQLQNILKTVEEIEQDTSDVDVKSMRRIFEDVPTWVVSSQEKKQKKAKAEHRVERSPLCKDNAESMSSMAHVFGDLERASEEIMTLKEQTLARLMDIEEAIKKALYSVSTLKSDSDIAGLSCLFKESLGTVQRSTSSGNISKISIGSSRTKTQRAQESPPTQRDTGLPVSQSTSLDVASEKPRASPPSSPAFISIQSAARGTGKAETETCPTCQQSPKTEEKFWTTKTLKCNSAAEGKKKDQRKGCEKQTWSSPLDAKRELSVLQVQTDPDGKSVIGTRTITENYERTDNLGNRFYSTKTSTVVTTPPDTTTSLIGQAVSSPATYQVSTYPEVQPPINRKH